MNKNKGIIGIGLILAIVLGIVVVGGGAYFLGKSSPKQEVNNLPIVDDKSTDTNSQVVKTLNSSINVLSPNGGEVYKDTDKIIIKWAGIGKERVAIYLRFSSGEWCFVKDLPLSITNYDFTPYRHNCGGDGRGSISGTQKYKITLITYNNGGMAPEPGVAFAGDYSDNDGSDTEFSIDSSDNYFIINSGTESASQKCIDTAKSLLPAYISRGELLDLKLNKVEFFVSKSDASNEQYFYPENSNDACMVSISYSVKPKPELYKNWLAGNGHESSDGWIINKSGNAIIDKNSNGYYVYSVGSGL